MAHTKSPLRYPGGKTQLSEFVRQNLRKEKISGTYIEPFSGGAGIALELLLSGDIKKIVINDFDPSIYSIWHAILNETNEFISLIDSVPFDYASPHSCSPTQLLSFWDKQKNIHSKFSHLPHSIENAFSTFMLNRMNTSGVINGGPIGGRKQNGKYQIDARFNKKTLIRKITAIANRKSDIDLYNLDANDLINEIQKKNKYQPDDTFIFFDPPYYAQGKNLYMSFFNMEQHSMLAKNILSLDDYFWITTYDHEPEIFNLYKESSKSYEYSITYSANQRGIFSEYMFTNHKSDLYFPDKMKVNKL